MGTWIVAPGLMCAIGVVVVLLPRADALEARDDREATAYGGTWALIVATLAVIALIAGALTTIA